MTQKTIYQQYGQLKRNYSQEDFNPFKALSCVYDNLLVNGAGNRVLIIGHSNRFREDVLKAWSHVLVDKGVVTGHCPAPVVEFNEVTAPSGEILQFETIADNYQHQAHLIECLSGANALCLFSGYESADILNVAREASNTIRVLDFHKNNETSK